MKWKHFAPTLTLALFCAVATLVCFGSIAPAIANTGQQVVCIAQNGENPVDIVTDVGAVVDFGQQAIQNEEMQDVGANQVTAQETANAAKKTAAPTATEPFVHVG